MAHRGHHPWGGAERGAVGGAGGRGRFAGGGAVGAQQAATRSLLLFENVFGGFGGGVEVRLFTRDFACLSVGADHKAAPGGDGDVGRCQGGVGQHLGFNIASPLTGDFPEVLHSERGLQISHYLRPPAGDGFRARRPAVCRR